VTNSREHFFVRWLPARFQEFVQASPQLNDTQCSILVQVDGEDYWVEVNGGTLISTSGAREQTSTLRLHTDDHTFNQLIAPAAERADNNDPMLRFVQLDSEALGLLQNVPGCLKLGVKGPDRIYSLVLGPGSQPVDNIGCRVECSLADMLSLQKGEVQPIELLMDGRLTLDGDLQIAMALGGLLM
jgi:hypothetical protein